MLPVGDIAYFEFIESFKADATMIICLINVFISLYEELCVVCFFIFFFYNYSFLQTEKLNSFLEFLSVRRKTVLQTDDIKDILAGKASYPAGKVNTVLGGDTCTLRT